MRPTMIAVLNCITVGPTQGLALALQTMCAEMSDVCVLKALDQFPNATEAARLLNVLDPDGVLLEIHPSERCLELAAELRRARSGLVMVGYARQCDRTRRQEALEAGVSEVLVAPFTVDDLRRALLRAFESRPAEPLDNLIAWLPAKPGSGASLAAVNAAADLARAGREVLLIDADRANGVLSNLLGIEPVHTLDDALASAHELNDGMWGYRRLRTRGFDLLPMPRRPTARTFAPWAYYRLLAFLRCRYTDLLVDLPDASSGGSPAFLKQARTVCLVSGPDSSSLFLAERRVLEMRALGIPDSRIRLVVNRASQATEELLGQSVLAALPEDPVEARAVVVSPESELGHGYSALARRLAGLPEPEPLAEQPGGVLSLFRRRRAAGRNA